jgi:CRP-like cAMP-binding protein
MLDVLARSRPFVGLPEGSLAGLIAAGRHRSFRAGAELMRQGEASDCLHLIISGQVRVLKLYEDAGGPIELAVLGAGEVVGEMGVLDGDPRSATVEAIEPTRTLQVGAEELAQLIFDHPEIGASLLRTMSHRLRNTNELASRMARTVLARVPQLNSLPPRVLEQLASRGERRTFLPGAVLMRQGDASDCMHVIMNGRVRVEQSHAALIAPIELAVLGRGEVVGEMGVLDGGPRSATVLAIEPAETFELGADVVADVILENPEVGARLLRTMSRRIRDTNELAAAMARKGR